MIELNSFPKSVSSTLKQLSVGIASYDYNYLVEDSTYEGRSFTSCVVDVLEF